MDWECGDAAADRRGARRGRRRRAAAARQPAADPDADGAARRGRRLRPGHRRVHGLDELAGAARDAPADDGVRVRDPRDEDALHLAAASAAAFGTKIFLYPEYVLMAALAEKIGRPVKWIESRRENYAATTHGRDHITYLEVGAKQRRHDHGAEGRRRSRTSAASSRRSRPGIPTTLYGRMLSGAYRIPAIHCQVIGVYTNTGMVDAYRGAGRPEATYVVERAIDLVARELGARSGRGAAAELHPARRLPLRPAASSPGSHYDSGEYEKALDRALEIVDYDDFRAEQEQARARGPLPRDRLLDLRRDLRRRAVGVDRDERRRAGAPASGRARTCASTSPARSS